MSFAFWLGHAFDEAGYDSLPAQSTRSATELLYLADLILEVVVIEACLPGAGDFVKRLRGAFPGIKAVATLPEDGSNVSDLSVYDTARVKTPTRDAPAAAAWVALVQSLWPPPRRLRGAGL